MLDQTLVRFGATVSLLVFQATAFLVPWLAILWLSNTENINTVADFSLLLAFVAPLCLLMATPSRNFLLSGDDNVGRASIRLRAFFSVLGVSIIAAVGYWQGALLLAIALFVCKNGEFYYDIAIADLLRNDKKRALLVRALRKTLFTVIGVGITLWSNSLILGLSILGLLFIADATVKTPHVNSSRKASEVASQALPLSLNALIFSVYFYVPRYILGAEAYAQQLAVFTVSSFLIMLTLIVCNAYCQSQLAVWRRFVAKDQAQRLMQSLYRTLALLTGLFILLQLFHLPGLYQPFWAAHNNINQQQPELMLVYHQTLLLAFGPMLFSFANYLLIVSHHHRFLLTLTLTNTVICTGLGWWCFHTFGFTGLVTAVAICGTLQFAICLVKLLRSVGGANV